MVLPNENLIELAERIWEPQSIGSKLADGDNIRIPFRVLHCQIGNLPDALAQADVAIASTGTVTMECAFFGVPAVTLYKTSWATYELGKRIVKVKSLTMPNLLADEEVFPEFIQNAATAKNIADAALELLQNESRQKSIKAKLTEIVSSLGGPGASVRAARAIANLLEPRTNTNDRENQKNPLVLAH